MAWGIEKNKRRHFWFFKPLNVFVSRKNQARLVKKSLIEVRKSLIPQTRSNNSSAIPGLFPKVQMAIV